MTFKIYKGDEVVVEGESPLEIKGLGSNKSVAKGEYQAVRVEDDKESERVDVPAFKTLPIAVTGVTVKPTEVELEVGETQQLTPIVTPSNATNKAVTYASKAQGIAGVDDKGLITAKVAGKTEIVVSTVDGDKKAVCTVTVKEPVVNVTGVTLAPNNMTGEAGKASNRQLNPTVAPANATNKKVTYAVAPKTDGLTVNASGVLAWTATVPAGEYTVTVTTEDGKKTDTSKLVLSEPEPEPDPEEPEEE